MSARDTAREAKLLASVERLVERQVGLKPAGFASAVQHRLSVGEIEFGDAFLRRNNAAAAREEAHDLAAYAACLELRRLELAGRLDDGVRDDLLRAAAAAAAADTYLERTLRERRR